MHFDLKFSWLFVKRKKKTFLETATLTIKITHLETHSLTYFYWGVRTVLYCWRASLYQTRNSCCGKYASPFGMASVQHLSLDALAICRLTLLIATEPSGPGTLLISRLPRRSFHRRTKVGAAVSDESVTPEELKQCVLFFFPPALAQSRSLWKEQVGPYLEVSWRVSVFIMQSSAAGLSV